MGPSPPLWFPFKMSKPLQKGGGTSEEKNKNTTPDASTKGGRAQKKSDAPRCSDSNGPAPRLAPEVADSRELRVGGDLVTDDPGGAGDAHGADDILFRLRALRAGEEKS